MMQRELLMSQCRRMKCKLRRPRERKKEKKERSE